jgi:hypothetical protein
MGTNWKVGLVVLVLLLVACLAVPLFPGYSAAQKEGTVTRGAPYTVVGTDGSHIIVVDNSTSKLYYYSIDRDGKIGDELKLRGTVDLRDVGKPSLKPVEVKATK